MIPARSGGLLAAEVVKAVREGDIDAVRSWLAAGGDEFVNEPALYEYRRPLDRRLCKMAAAGATRATRENGIGGRPR